MGNTLRGGTEPVYILASHLMITNLCSGQSKPEARQPSITLASSPRPFDPKATCTNNTNAWRRTESTDWMGRMVIPVTSLVVHCGGHRSQYTYHESLSRCSFGAQNAIYPSSRSKNRCCLAIVYHAEGRAANSEFLGAYTRCGWVGDGHDSGVIPYVPTYLQTLHEVFGFNVLGDPCTTLHLPRSNVSVNRVSCHVLCGRSKSGSECS